MKQSMFTEERIIAILREQEAGSKTGDVCRKHGISSATFYKWKAKYGGRDVSEARRLKVLTDENAKLKKLLAEAMLDNAMLKDHTAFFLCRALTLRSGLRLAGGQPISTSWRIASAREGLSRCCQLQLNLPMSRQQGATKEGLGCK